MNFLFRPYFWRKWLLHERISDQWESVPNFFGLTQVHTLSLESFKTKYKGYCGEMSTEFRLRRMNLHFFKIITATDVFALEGEWELSKRLGNYWLWLEREKESIEAPILASASETFQAIFLEQMNFNSSKSRSKSWNLFQLLSEYGWKQFPGGGGGGGGGGAEVGFQASKGFEYIQAMGSYRIPTYPDLYYKGPNLILQRSANLQNKRRILR